MYSIITAHRLMSQVSITLSLVLKRPSTCASAEPGYGPVYGEPYLGFTASNL